MSAVIKQENPLQPVTQQSALLAVIARAAADPTVDIDKMERLFALQQSIIDQDRKAAFNEALNRAQAEMTRIATDATNPQTRSRYASYAQLDRAVRPIYTRHGFALSFDEGTSDKAGHVRVLCNCSHTAGHTHQYHADMPIVTEGFKGAPNMTQTHATGSAKAYGKRYLLKDIWNIAVGDGDTDGNTEAARISEKQIADLEALITEVNAKRDAFMRYYKIEKLSDIRVTSYETIVKSLVAKRKQS